MNRLILSFVLALGFASPATAAVPFVQPFQPAELGAQEVSLPQPAALDPNWWQYFDTAEDEALEQRTARTLDRLARLQAQLPESAAEPARQFVERIRTNLQALPEARKQPSPTLPASPVVQTGYTIQELLDIAWRLRNLQAKVQADRDEVDSIESDIKAAHRQIDTLMAAYLSLSPEDPARVLRGLEIMADRSAVAIAEEQLRIGRAALRAAELSIRYLSNEQTVAAERLVATEAALERLNADIEQAQAGVEKAEKHLATAKARAAQARASSTVSDDPEAEATALYHLQQARRAAVIEAIGKTRLTALQAERLLVLLLLDAAGLDNRALRDHQAELFARLAEIRRQAAAWSRDSRRERDRASEAVARTSGMEEAAALTFMKLLNQNRVELAQETLVALQGLEEMAGPAELLLQQVEAQLMRREGRLRDWLARVEQTLQQFWEATLEWANQSLFKFAGTPVTTLGLLRIALIIFLAWLLSYWLRHALRRYGRRADVNQPALYTVERVSHYVLIALGFIVGLSSIGIDLTNFALVAGAIGIGIGFGIQSIVKNFLAGLVLLFERSLKVGDFVELASGVAGEVRAINVRSTVINTNDNVDIVVPNSQFIENDVINWTLVENYRRIHVRFRVAYGTDKELVQKAVLEAADKLKHTMRSRRPGVWLVDFADNGLEFELVVWVTHAAVKRPGAVHAAYRWEIESALRKYDIEVPLPQLDLRLRQDLKEMVGELLNRKDSGNVYPLR